MDFRIRHAAPRPEVARISFGGAAAWRGAGGGGGALRRMPARSERLFRDGILGKALQKFPVGVP